METFYEQSWVCLVAWTVGLMSCMATKCKLPNAKAKVDLAGTSTPGARFAELLRSRDWLCALNEGAEFKLI